MTMITNSLLKTKARRTLTVKTIDDSSKGRKLECNGRFTHSGTLTLTKHTVFVVVVHFLHATLVTKHILSSCQIYSHLCCPSLLWSIILQTTTPYLPPNAYNFFYTSNRKKACKHLLTRVSNLLTTFLQSEAKKL